MIQPILALLACVLAADPAGGIPRFEHHVIDSVGKALGQTDLVDVNNDGKLDYVVGESSQQGGRLWWFEFVAPDKWVRHDIGKGHTSVGGDCHDITGNGLPDFWGGAVLFLNKGDGAFSRHEIGGLPSAHDCEFGDIDGDGRMDGLANSDTYGLAWYKIPEDPTQTWTEHMICTSDQHKIHGGVAPRGFGDLNGGDLNGNGKIDVVTAEAWYENLDGKGTAWKQHKAPDFLGEKHVYGIHVCSWVGDINGDGHNDIVQSEGDNPDGRVAYFENDGKGDFNRHMIKDKGEKQDFHSLVVADFNNDGCLDIFSGGGPLTTLPYKCYIWENLGDGKWREHVIATEKKSHEAVAGDVDGDGDIDIVTKAWAWSGENNMHHFFENKLK